MNKKFLVDLANVKMKLHAYIELMRVDRPIGIYLLLWPALWALWIASNGRPHATVLVVFILGVIITRSAGCVINDFADRHIDGHISRTYHRPLASGVVQPFEAIVLFSLLGTVAFFLVLLLNWLAVILAAVGGVITIIYPFLKRFTYFPQLILGFAMSWGIPIAFAAETGRLSWLMMFVFLISYLWVIVYDAFYAMSDRPDDLIIGVKSIAIWLGRYDRLITGLLQIVIVFLLFLLGQLLFLGFWFNLAVLVASGLVGYQQWLIKNRNPSRCFQAFLNNHWFGLAIFAGLFLSYLN